MDPSDGNDSKDTFTSQERDIIVASYDTNGAYRWGFSAGGSGRDGGHGIKTGTDGSIILTGFFSGTANLDPLGNNSGSVSSMGGWDIFLAKYDSNVKLKWVNSWGGSGNEQVRPGGIAVDRDNDIYLYGDFASTVDFDPGSGVANSTSKGLGDIFLAKYDTNGNYIWATGFGGGELDGAHRIDVDSQGNLVITGWFRGTVDFDPSPQGPCILTAKSSGSGASDIFLAKYDNNGNYVWAYSFGDKVTTADEWSLGTGVAIDSSDNVAATGRFYGGIDFDTTDEVFMRRSAGMADVFIIKYDETGKPIMRRN
jgi:hypothetical protein